MVQWLCLGLVLGVCKCVVIGMEVTGLINPGMFGCPGCTVGGWDPFFFSGTVAVWRSGFAATEGVGVGVFVIMSLIVVIIVIIICNIANVIRFVIRFVTCSETCSSCVVVSCFSWIVISTITRRIW